MLAETALEQHQFEAVARGMALRDGVPAAMFDRDARFVADRLEAHLDLGRLILGEARQAPAEGEAFAGAPVRYPADLPLLAIVEARDEAPVRPRGIDRKSTRLNSSH